VPPFRATAAAKSPLVYGALVLILALIAGWQAVEHRRVQQAARAALINRSHDITSTLGLVLRSQRRWGMVSQERLESALKELVRSGEAISLALLNAAGEVVVSAGEPISFESETPGMMQAGERWDARQVTLVHLVDLGVTSSDRGETNRPTIVMPRRDREGPGPAREENREPREGREGRDGREREPRDNGDGHDDRPTLTPPTLSPDFRASEGGGLPGELGGTNRTDRGGPPRFGRPPRLSESEYQELVERRGLHGLIIAMATDGYRQAVRSDLWMRGVIGLFAGVSVFGLGLAWRNLVTSGELQLRLFRASELTTHLKEMNVAAAGLAHETRNPLNIIRGLAHMISRQNDASAEVREKSREIIEEADRVAAQLNEFINYSRPREVRRSAVALSPVVAEVARALTYDLEEKCIRLRLPGDLPVVEADEQLLRQALFNLLLNAIQAVERGGDIEVAAARQNAQEATLEIRDNGPGVPPEQRAEIFKPYFTTHQKGTGLGLAVVQQIVLAHGWEIEYVPHEPRGAIFRLSHLKPAARS
jgi:signal transduction histidine kinase